MGYIPDGFGARGERGSDRLDEVVSSSLLLVTFDLPLLALNPPFNVLMSASGQPLICIVYIWLVRSWLCTIKGVGSILLRRLIGHFFSVFTSPTVSG